MQKLQEVLLAEGASKCTALMLSYGESLKVPVLKEPSITQDLLSAMVTWCTGLRAGEAQRTL